MLLGGVPIIVTADISADDMLIFTVDTDSQRSRYSTCKINFYLKHTKELIAIYKIMINGFLTIFI